LSPGRWAAFTGHRAGTVVRPWQWRRQVRLRPVGALVRPDGRPRL